MPIKPDKYSKLNEDEMDEVETEWVKNPTHSSLAPYWEANKKTKFNHIRKKVLRRK